MRTTFYLRRYEKIKVSTKGGKDNYPKETNAHNALADAKWDKELYNFIQSL